MVKTSEPSASTANTEQALTGLPSSNNVQAPQTCMSQPSFAPVKPSCSRTISRSVVRGSTSILRSRPLTLSEIAFFMIRSVAPRPFMGLACRAFDQGPHHGPLVIFGSAQIARRTAFLGCLAGSLLHKLRGDFFVG